MTSKTMIVSLALCLSFGSAWAKVDEIDLAYNAPPPVAEPATTTTIPEHKEPIYAPEPDPKPEPPSCATPRDGQDSKDEGDRIMCTSAAPPPSQSRPQ
jgi:hypothetical protein